MKMKLWAFMLLGLGAMSSLPLEGYENANYETCCDVAPCCDGTYFVGADWLYWRTHETKLEYGAAVSQTTEDADVFINSSVLVPKFKYDNGYRVFAGYTTCDNLWTVRATFNHIPTKARNSFSSADEEVPTFATLFNTNFPILSALSGVTLTGLDAHWTANINYLDLDISRRFTICSCLDVTPYIGLRGLWFDQRLRLNGSNETASFESKLTGKIYAGGVVGGIKAAWELCRGFSLVGNIGGSLLYAKYSNRGILAGSLDNQGSLNIRYSDNNHKGLPMFDAFIGLQYAACLCDYMVNFLVGWEQHIIYSTNEFSLSEPGYTSMQGLTLGASVGF